MEKIGQYLNNREHIIVLFDGYCNLCSSTVQFILKRKKNNLFRFASLQSKAGQELLDHFGINTATYYTIVAIMDRKHRIESSAVLNITRNLKFPWNLCYGFIIVPKFIRDALYRFISKHRFNWFGKKESCYLPDSSVENLFL